MQGSLYIVDAFNYLFRAFHALPPLRTRQGQPTGAIYGLCQMLLRIEREHNPTHLCAAFDSPGPNFRDKLYAEYKANRPSMPDDLRAQISLVPEVLKAFGLASVTAPGFEADDIIATATRMARERGLSVVICSSDKDLMQLVQPGVSMLDTMKNRMIGPSEVEQKWGVAPDKVGDLLALVGDTSDNVPGVPGVGPKTAADLLNRYGDLAGLLANLGEVKGKRGQALVDGRETIALARKLVSLDSHVPIEGGLDVLARVPADGAALQTLFRTYEFTRLIADDGDKKAPATVANDLKKAADVPDTSAAPAEVIALPEAPAPKTVQVTDAKSMAELTEALGEATDISLAILLDGPALNGALCALSIAIASKPVHHIPVAQGLGQGLLGPSAALSEKAILDALRPALEAASPKKHCHGCKEIITALSLRGIHVQGIVSDTLLAAYVLDPSRASHDLSAVAAAEGIAAPLLRTQWLGTGRNAKAPGDIEPAIAGENMAREALATLAVGEKQAKALQADPALNHLCFDIELPLAHVLSAIEQNGIRIDAAFLKQLAQETAVAANHLEGEIHELAGSNFNIGSPKQLQKILFETLQLPVMRKTKTGASTDADVLEKLAPMHPVPDKILQYRQLTKLKNTYLDALPALINPRTGRIHTTFNQAVAATGRLSSSDPNLQNIPIRTELGRKIRHAFIPADGMVILAADYSQIELRILAHFSQDPAFMDAFFAGQDIHQRTASEVFGVPLQDVTGEQRRIAKAINFGLVFGQSDFGLSQALRIPRAEAKSYIESYFQRYAGVKTYMDKSIAEAKKNGETATLLGRRRPLPELSASRAQMRNHGERMARNTPIQGSAADILKVAMIDVARGLHTAKALTNTTNVPEAPAAGKARMLLTVHDELVFEVPKGDAEAFGVWVKARMENAYKLDVPLVVEVGWGDTWGDAH